MPRGYPDDFGSQMFPMYGQLVRISTTHTLLASEVWTAFDIAAKGVLYFLHIESKASSGYNDLDIELTVDGAVFFWESVTDMHLYQNLFLSSQPLVLLYDDTPGQFLTIGLAKDVPFASQIKLKIENGGITTPNLEVRGGYTQLQ